MKTVTLTIGEEPELFLDAYMITPDNFAGKSLESIAALEIYEGNQKSTLGDYFEITGESGATAAETRIVVTGNPRKVKRIGQKMTAGEIIIEGNADMYTGGWMLGGLIHVKGNVDAFAGMAMEGGELLVDGDAGNYLGAAYRGDWRGMKGGLIRVKGNTGNDIGTAINGGTIIVEGNAFIHVSTHGNGGTVIVKGDVEARVGGQMVKGDIYVLGSIKYMLPGYKLVESGVQKEVDGETLIFDHYIGDLGEYHKKAKGEVVYANLYVKTAAPADLVAAREERIQAAHEQKKAKRKAAASAETASIADRA
jgi:formylmethanofuran dehydrogenase subunit C